MKQTGRVTQKDVAEGVGVNQKTVSMAFRSPDRLAPPTLERILHKARELGYRPNPGARAIRTGRFDNVMLVCSDHERHSNVPTEVLFGIHDHLRQQGVSLTLGRLSDRELSDAMPVPGALFDHGADGVIINIDVMLPQRLVDILSRFQIPGVWLNTKQPQNCIHPDDFRAGRDATRQLLDLGHRHIVYIDFFKSVRDEVRHYSKDDRLSGYESAMQAAGLQPHYILPDHCLANSASTEYIAGQLEHMPEVTAAVTYSGDEAAGVMRAVEIHLDGRIPESFSVMTFAGQSAPFCGLKLSGMIAPEHELGARAAALLLQLIRQPETPLPTEVLPFRLEPGETCARPPV